MTLRPSAPDEDVELTLEQTLATLRRRDPGEQPAPDTAAFQRYFHGIAEAHHVIRRVFRIVDERAKRAGIDPLEHKVLIQILGAPGAPLRVNDVAARLDIPSALASRLVKALEAKGLVTRLAGDRDRRITRVAITDVGRERLAGIDQDVRLHVEYFQSQLTDTERVAALQIFAFYLGGHLPAA